MAQFMKKALQLTPNQLLYQQKRFRGKINLKKPKIFFKKAVVNKLVEPFFINPSAGKSLEELCWNRIEKEKIKELGPYDKILAREVRNWFDQSKMIACLHVNSLPEREKFEVKVPLYRANMYYKQYGPHIVFEAIKDSPYGGIAPLVSKCTAFVFSPDINVRALQKIINKCKKMFTLGGILEGHVLSHDDFLKYGEMNMTSVQLGLVQLLQNAGGANLNRQLTHHQSTLVTRLKQIGTNETTSANDTTSDKSE
ncbi:large ribosomal subunit protein uL10m isoform X2 [Megachile rotundata]|uniref:large ribosomal subunit protein uL10m isoform X2 n=1 Tax=Megachile rotundata TaxID=143995 RepID=UPI00061526EC|nr:PREDICTED: 39S ribosomal protein L10, mitochondrial isoform X2 [Megachile rotundata]